MINEKRCIGDDDDIQLELFEIIDELQQDECAIDVQTIAYAMPTSDHLAEFIDKLIHAFYVRMNNDSERKEMMQNFVVYLSEIIGRCVDTWNICNARQMGEIPKFCHIVKIRRVVFAGGRTQTCVHPVECPSERQNALFKLSHVAR